MKIITKNNMEEYMITGIVNVYICFEDLSEARLSCVLDTDTYLTHDEFSIFKFESRFCNEEIESHFVGNKFNHVTYVNMELEVIDKKGKECSTAYWIVPCDMKITGYNVHSEKGESCTTIELMGRVK